MKKVTLSTCWSCEGNIDALKKIEGVDEVEGLVVIGNFDVDDVVKAMDCHHSVLRSIENDYEPPKNKEEKEEGGCGSTSSVVYVYTHTYSHYNESN